MHGKNLGEGFGETENCAISNAPVAQIGGEDASISTNWLAGRGAERPVLMFEGREKTSQSLRIAFFWRGHEVGEWGMGLSISPVKEMMRYVNIRPQSVAPMGINAATGEWGTNTAEPPNYPDGYFNAPDEKLKTLVSIHGLDWDEDETPAGNAEIFKRCFQAGVNARFVGTSWASEIARLRERNQQSWWSRLWGGAESTTNDLANVRERGPLNYGFSVMSAFLSAKLFSEFLEPFSGEDSTILAHSLGNMVTSSMIHDYDFVIGKYIMLSAAVPTEAYEGITNMGDKKGMTNPAWRRMNYPDRVLCAAWNTLFSNDDPRHCITWNGRFSNVPNRTEVCQCYAVLEETLKPNGAKDGIPVLASLLNTDTVYNRERTWVFYEITKGDIFFTRALIDRHKSAGWGFGTGSIKRVERSHGHDSAEQRVIRYSSAEAREMSVDRLIKNPFFKLFDESADGHAPLWIHDDSEVNDIKPAWIYQTNVTVEVLGHLPFVPLAGAEDGKILHHAKLLAEMIPPLSNPAGTRKLVSKTSKDSKNMQTYVNKDNGWPERRPGLKTDAQNNRWLHSDYLNAPPYLTMKLYWLFRDVINNSDKGGG